MPQRNKRARQAQAQRSSNHGNRFDSGWTDTLEESLADPDFEPADVLDLDSDADTFGNTGYAFTLVDAKSDNSGSNNSARSSSEGSDVEELASMNCIEKVAEWTDRRKRPRVLGALPAYSGMGKTTMWKKQKALKKAAEGTAKISNFFKPMEHPTRDTGAIGSATGHSSSTPNLQVPEYDDFWAYINVNRSQSVTTFSSMANSVPPSSMPASSVHEDSERDVNDNNIPDPGSPTPPSPLPLDNSVSADTAGDWLDLDPVDDYSGVYETEVTVYDTVCNLLKEAKQHKATTALFKLQGVKSYLELVDRFRRNPNINNPMTRASTTIAMRFGKGPYFARQIRHLSGYINRFRTLPPTSSGKHHGHPSLLNNEDILHAVRRYLNSLGLGEITPKLLQKQVNAVIIPGIGLDLGQSKISEVTAWRWLKRLGYLNNEVKKGVYVHERDDVVAYRAKYLADMASRSHLCTIFDDETLQPIEPTLAPGYQLHVPVFQDESIFRSNELRRRVWMKNGKQPLRKKGQGCSIHVSDFIVEKTGYLKLTSAQTEAQRLLPEAQRVVESAREIIYPGKNADGWWNAQRLVTQVIRIMPLFEALYPGAVGEFIFDQSTAHAAFADDALIAGNINVNPGGKKKKMHSTVIPNDNPSPSLRGTVQTMVYPDNHPDPELRGKSKGMRAVLQERGLWDQLCAANPGKVPLGDCKDCKLSEKAREKLAQEEAQMMAGLDEGDDDDEVQLPTADKTASTINQWCCMQKVLSLQTDFINEKPLLQQVIEKRGHICIFLPKFHCELNPIEMYWGWVKIRYRCLADGTWKMAKTLVPELLDACEVKTIRAFFRKSWRYSDAYQKGLNVQQAEYAVKKFKSHWRIPQGIMMDIATLTNPAP